MFDFLKIGQSVRAISDKYRLLLKELDEVRAEIPKVLYAPTNKADLRVTVDRWVEKSKADFALAVVTQVTKRNSSGENKPYDLGFLPLVKTDSGEVTANTMDIVMCAVFGDQIKRAIVSAIDDMPWPDEGLAQAARAEQLARLRKRETELSSEIAELLKNAETAGIDI